MNYDQLFPSRFLKAGDFAGKAVTLTVKDVYHEEIENDRGATDTKAIMSFFETKRELVLIKTNAQLIKAMFGPETDDWRGHKITFHPERDPSGLSDSGFCIRVKGSPELDKPINVQVKLPRRRPQPRKLVPTTPAGEDPIEYPDEEQADFLEAAKDDGSRGAFLA